jgi:hypothetical protein
MNKSLCCASVVGFFLLAACGSKPPTQANAANEFQSSETPPASTGESATPESKGSSADAGTEAPKPKSSGSGRPVPIYSGVSQPQTVGLDGAVFRTDDDKAELRIPGGWYREARNVILLVDKRPGGAPGRIGGAYVVHIQRPETEFRVGEESPSETVETQSDPFVLKLPLPAGVQSANLAIETITPDPKTKRNKSTWSIVAMTKPESMENGTRAVFEIRMLPDGRVHLTTGAPTAAPGGG